MTPSRGSDTEPGALFFPLRESKPLEGTSHRQRTKYSQVIILGRQKLNAGLIVLDELPEESHGAEDHASRLGLLRLGAGHRERIVHVALLVQNDLVHIQNECVE